MTEALSIEAEFELVYEGPADDSPSTLRRLKGAFIADLEFSIEEVQHILMQAPLVIKTAADSKNLESPYRVLKNAGAKVMIVRKKIIGEIADFKITDDLIQQALDDPSTVDNENSQPETDLEIEFSFAEETDEPEQKLDGPPIPMPTDDEPVLGVAYQKQINAAETPSPPTPAPVINAKKQDNLPLFDAGNSGALTLSDAAPDTLPLVTSPAETAQTQPAEEDLDRHLNIISQSLFEIADKEPPSKDPAAYSLNELELVLDQEPSAGSKIAQPETLSNDLPLQLKPELPESKVTPESAPALAPPPPPSTSPSLRESPSTPPAQPQGDDYAPAIDDYPLFRNERPRPKRSNFSRDTIAWIAGGAVALTLGNYLYFATRPLKISEEQVAHLKAASQLASKSEENKNLLDDDNNRFQSKTIQAKKKSGDLIIDYKITLLDGKPDTISMVLALPEPPPLSKEEIVRHQTAPPWLSKIELVALPLMLEQAGQFKAAGPAKAFITYAEQKIRSIAAATVQGSFNETEMTARGILAVSLEGDGETQQIHQGDGFKVEALGGEKFRINVVVDF